MPLGVAGVAQGYVFDAVVPVHVHGVGHDVGFVPVQLPEAEDYGVQLDDVVALETVSPAASKAGGSFVSTDPIPVRYRRADLPLETLYFSVLGHGLLYAWTGFALTKLGICADMGVFGCWSCEGRI